ncbi:hypothetical protein PMAYCL1PPCAC_28641, partial [Pristionchus mayeri]
AASTGATGGSSSNGPGTSYDRGVPLNLGSYHEWEITEIGYDGTEKFKIPHGYSEHIGALARKIDWMSLAGEDSIHDNPALLKDKEKEVDAGVDESSKKGPKAEERTLQEAGPWHVVAKHLHESLQQLNVLLDDLAILRTTEYLKPMRVADQLQNTNDPVVANEVTSMIQTSKMFQWSSKRKALMEAADVFVKSVRHRRKQEEMEAGNRRNKDGFYIELGKMRELYRIRKNGENIVGDLGYKMFGIKMDPRGVFGIGRRSVEQMKNIPKGRWEPTVLYVTIPSDLMRQSSLYCSIVKDDGSHTAVYPEKPNSEYAYMEIDKKSCEEMPWQLTLKRAQETLIIKDIYEQLCKEAAMLTRKTAVFKDGVLLVSLFDDYLLRIELQYYPFDLEMLPFPKETGDPFLTRFLREFHLSMECSRPVRPQMLVDLPLTHLPESLDYRGPLAYTYEDIECRAIRTKALLHRLMSAASHKLMVKRTIQGLNDFQVECGDPNLRWRIVRCSPLHSLFIGELHNRNYDHISGGKLSFYIQVDEYSATLQTKEGHEINCRRDLAELRQALHLMATSHEILSVSNMAKQVFYQVLHANMNAMDPNGVPCPTLLLVNPASTRTIFVKFPLGEVPQVFVREFITSEITDDRGNRLTMDDMGFTALNYHRIPGNSLCKKFDILFSMLKD